MKRLLMTLLAALAAFVVSAANVVWTGAADDGLWAGSSVALKPDAARRVWTAEIPVPPVKAARSGKPMHPCAKATVLGGAIDVPIMTALR